MLPGKNADGYSPEQIKMAIAAIAYVCQSARYFEMNLANPNHEMLNVPF